MTRASPLCCRAFRRSHKTNFSEAVCTEALRRLILFNHVKCVHKQVKAVLPSRYWGSSGSQVILRTEEVDGRRGTEDNRKSSGESDSDSRAATEKSCAVKLLDSCPAPFPHGVSVWRLTAGLSKRPPPRFASPPMSYYSWQFWETIS